MPALLPLLLTLPLITAAQPDRAADAKLRASIKELTADLEHASPDARARAARRLGEIGPPAAKEGMAPLKRLLKDRSAEVRGHAAFALLLIDQATAKAAVPVMVQAIQAPGSFFSFEVLSLIEQLRPAHRDLVQALAEAAGSEHTLVWIMADSALARTDPKTKDLLPVLDAGLKSDKPRIRLVAARALARVAPQRQKDALPVLHQGLEDRDSRWLVAHDLLEMDGSQKEVVIKAFLPLLKAEGKDRLQAALFLLPHAAGEREQVKGVLREAMKSDDVSVRLRAVEGLADWGPKATPAEDVLRAALEDRDSKVVIAAAEARLRIRPEKARELFSLLLDLLAKHDQQARAAQELIGLVEQLRKIHEAEMEKLKGMGKSTEELEAEWVADLARNIEKPLRGEVKEGKRGELLQLYFILEVGRLGAKAKEAVPVLTRVLAGGKTPLLRGQAALALGRVGSGARAAVPLLVEVYKSERERDDVRHCAHQALLKIDPSKAK
jgi:HEAT repeat protein